MALFDWIHVNPQDALDNIWAMTEMPDFDFDPPIVDVDTAESAVTLCAIQGYPSAVFTMPPPRLNSEPNGRATAPYSKTPKASPRRPRMNAPMPRATCPSISPRKVDSRSVLERCCASTSRSGPNILIATKARLYGPGSTLDG
ncbi:MAG: hypothetical protein PHI55_11930 [Burkholderiaceae bacterium]|nr:hypothetical protein [Burkholderiaceae bacterium]